MIPKYETIMLPLLKFLADEKVHALSGIEDYIIKLFSLTEEEKRELLPSGQQTFIHNRIGWAKTYLKKAGLLETVKRAHFRITDRGLKVLEEKPTEINIKLLEQFPEFREFKTLKKPQEKSAQKRITDSLDPRELLEDSYQKMKNDLINELIIEIKKSSSRFFESIVVDLMVKMGYGGSRKDAGQAIGQSGDEGIDGIIKEDRLGLDAIYLQAKKWEGTVGRPEIHKFVGALKGQGANKGIFITISKFSREAVDYASKIEAPKVVLIDGTKLAELMIEYDIGVSKMVSYEIKKVNSDFFSEE